MNPDVCDPWPFEPGCCDLPDDADPALIERWQRVAYMATLANAIMCCLPGTATRGRRFLLGQAKAIGPEGGCVGVEQRVTVALPGCYTCPSEESP